MAADPVTPKPGNTSVVTVGGDAVVAVMSGPNGGFIVNPYTAADQGLSDVEPLLVDPVTEAILQGNGTTFAIEPGGTWDLIPGQTTPTFVNASSSGHKFSVVWW